MAKSERFDSSDENVFKYVFTKEGKMKAAYEAVLYRYGTFEERTVICCSVQSGCPVGCTFCGTGNQFIRNLKRWEIVEQIIHVMEDMKINPTEVKKLQIMFMSMGEPFLNYQEVAAAIDVLHELYPTAQLLISTIAPLQLDSACYGDFMELSSRIDKTGLQFSIHKSTDEARDQLIPFRNKLGLDDIAFYGREWSKAVGRQAYCNYCIDGTNNTAEDAARLFELFDPRYFCFTFSVICSADETMKAAGYKNLEAINTFKQMFVEQGYNTRTFDPAGQDDIGGGCGQLWYVQKWMKENRCAQ